MKVLVCWVNARWSMARACAAVQYVSSYGEVSVPVRFYCGRISFKSSPQASSTALCPARRATASTWAKR